MRKLSWNSSHEFDEYGNILKLNIGKEYCAIEEEEQTGLRVRNIEVRQTDHSNWTDL